MDKDQEKREVAFREMLRARRSGKGSTAGKDKAGDKGKAEAKGKGGSSAGHKPAVKPKPASTPKPAGKAGGGGGSGAGLPPSGGHPKKPRRQWDGPGRAALTVMWVGRAVLLLVLIGLVLVLLGMNRLYAAYEDVRADIELVAGTIEQVPGGIEATRIYARDYDPATGEGTLLATRSEENRSIVPYEDIPPALVACLLSTEDNRFFEHQGVDFLGTARAVARGVQRGGDIKGTSTITQQLSRNVFLPYIRSQKTLNRKIQEVIFAMALEKRFSKQEIVEGYLNHIFLGANSYGVRAAARKYFDKDLDELTLAECALFAGIPQAPTRYNPFEHPEEAKARRDTVLHLLKSRVGTDFFERLIVADPDKFRDFNLSEAEIDAALNEPITLNRHVDQGFRRAGYFADYIASDHVLYGRYNEEQVKRQGLVVQTTLDPQFQEWAEEIVQTRVDEQRESKRVSQAALILLEAKTGEVLACVGGYKFGHPNADGVPDMLNRAMVSDRPVGSAFKPFTYATAYEQGFPVTMTLWDGPNKELSEKFGKPWPLNSDMQYFGWISIFYALQRSRNAASVDLIVNCTGVEPVIETARKMGITSGLPPVPALTLGVADVRPVEMAEAFDTFVNGGMHVDHIVIKKIYLGSGILLESNDTDRSIELRSNRAFSENTAWMMVQNMRRVVEMGTGYNARVPGVQIAGKTGTNDDYADAWFVGYSPELVCAIWVGNDDYSQQMRRMFGGDLPAKMFQELMKRVYTKQTETRGEGEDAEEIVLYEPRYTQTEFQKFAGATFNGFPAPQVGAKLVKDEDGNWVPEEQVEEEPPEEEEGEDDGEEDSGDDDGNSFYEQWDPPQSGHVFF